MTVILFVTLVVRERSHRKMMEKSHNDMLDLNKSWEKSVGELREHYEKKMNEELIKLSHDSNIVWLKMEPKEHDPVKKGGLH